MLPPSDVIARVETLPPVIDDLIACSNVDVAGETTARELLASECSSAIGAHASAILYAD